MKFLIKSEFCNPRHGSPLVPRDDIPVLLPPLSSRACAELQEVRFG
ncbi:hypothetical protein [Paraburkholderia dilworthii]|nr:hypothetical protein [Paraburkholderia dilworthii]